MMRSKPDFIGSSTNLAGESLTNLLNLIYPKYWTLFFLKGFCINIVCGKHKYLVHLDQVRFPVEHFHCALRLLSLFFSFSFSVTSSGWAALGWASGQSAMWQLMETSCRPSPITSHSFKPSLMDTERDCESRYNTVSKHQFICFVLCFSFYSACFSGEIRTIKIAVMTPERLFYCQHCGSVCVLHVDRKDKETAIACP